MLNRDNNIKEYITPILLGLTVKEFYSDMN